MTAFKPTMNLRIVVFDPFMPGYDNNPAVSSLLNKPEKVVQQAWEDRNGNIDWRSLPQVSEKQMYKEWKELEDKLKKD